MLASGREIRQFPVRCCGCVSCCCYNSADCERRGLFDIEGVCIRTENEGVVYTEDECGVVMCISRQATTGWIRSKQCYVKELMER